MNPLIQIKTIAVFLILLACFALSPQARAVCEEGCLTNQNTVLGHNALFSLTTGYFNTAVGYNALNSNTTGVVNTALGAYALNSNTTGGGNTATGSEALEFNTVGNSNTATGDAALLNNTSGSDNTATGTLALYSNTTGHNNTATGDAALNGNETGSFNTATGTSALANNDNGNKNTANGVGALSQNVSGDENTAIGVSALGQNNAGNNNTATGLSALLSNTIGTQNTAYGSRALVNLAGGSSNIAIGSNAGRALLSGDNNIDIGNAGVAGDAGTIRIGTQGTQTKTFIAGISGATVAGGVGVIVGTNGKLGTVVSSARFKEAIKPMDKASEAILGLQPVTFRYKKELDPDGIPQFGLVAEDVENVNPDLVVRDGQGNAYSVRYDQVNAMLLNEFLKEHEAFLEEQCKVQELEAKAARQQKQIEALTAGLQEVKAQIELSKSAPQTVLNNH